MDNLKKKMIYLSCDGDGIGSLVARAALSDDEEGLHNISAHIVAGNETILDFCRKNGGKVISSGGDEANISIPLEALESAETMRSDYRFVTGKTLTIGVGSTLSEANKSLQVGKLTGKDKIVQYTPEVEEQYQQATQEANAK